MTLVIIGRNPYFSGLSFAIYRACFKDEVLSCRNPYFSGLSFAISWNRFSWWIHKSRNPYFSGLSFAILKKGEILCIHN